MEEHPEILTREEQATPKKTRWGLLFKLTVAAALLGTVIWLVDFQEFFNVAINADPWLLLAVVGMLYLDKVLMAYKWMPLLQVVGVRAPLPLLVRTYFVAQLAGMFLPSTIGGDLFRVYALSRHKMSPQAVMASIVAERVIGFVAMLVLVVLSLGLAFYLFRDSWAYLQPVVLLLLIAVGIGILLVGLGLGKVQRWVAALVKRLNWFPGVGKFYLIFTLYGEYRHHRSTLARVMAWTLVEQTFPIFAIYVLVLAFHIDVSLLAVATITPLMVLGLRLPISLDGLGVQEGLFVALFGLVGVSAAEALLLSASSRVLIAISALPWSLHYLFKRHHSLTLSVEPSFTSAQETLKT